MNKTACILVFALLFVGLGAIGLAVRHCFGADAAVAFFIIAGAVFMGFAGSD